MIGKRKSVVLFDNYDSPWVEFRKEGGNLMILFANCYGDFSEPEELSPEKLQEVIDLLTELKDSNDD